MDISSPASRLGRGEHHASAVGAAGVGSDDVTRAREMRPVVRNREGEGMSEHVARPGGDQPWPSQPYYAVSILTPSPPRKRRVAAVVGATAVIAAVAGGAGGAAIATLGTGSLRNAGLTATVASTGADVSSVAAKVLPSVVQLDVTTRHGEGIGSGVVLSSDGRILTNAHVVDGATAVTVILSDGRQYRADVVGSDSTADVAVVRTQGVSGLTSATLGDSSQLKVGQEVVALGSPGGLQNTVTTGIVSALNRNLAELADRPSRGDGDASPSYTAIQTDAAINQGNSGGPLVDVAGRVIGINSALYNPSGAATSVGIGFAIPINDAKTIVNQLAGT
jgi:putative serine protease PepD